MKTPDGSSYGLDSDAWLNQYEKSVRLFPEIREALAHFEQLFELAPAAFVVTDPELRITDANRAAAVLFNSPASRFRGKPLTVFVTRGERKVFLDIVAQVVRTDGPIVRPLCIRPGAGAEVDMVVTAVSIRDEANAVSSIYWVFGESLGREDVELL
jgi:PAS domain S-box-containing protein